MSGRSPRCPRRGNTLIFQGVTDIAPNTRRPAACESGLQSCRSRHAPGPSSERRMRPRTGAEAPDPGHERGEGPAGGRRFLRPNESVAKGLNIGSDGGTQIRNGRATLSQTKQRHGVATHHLGTLGGGEFRLRECVDVAARREQRMVRAEEHSIRAAEIGDRAIRRLGVQNTVRPPCRTTGGGTARRSRACARRTAARRPGARTRAADPDAASRIRDQTRRRGALSRVAVANRLAAVEHQRDVNSAQADATSSIAGDPRSKPCASALSSPVPRSPSLAQRRSSMIAPGCAGLTVAKQVSRSGWCPLHRDEMIVDAAQCAGSANGQPKQTRSVDPGRIHGGQQLVGGDDRARAVDDRSEPRIQLGERVAGVAHGRREDVDVAVDDHPSHRPCANIHVPGT